MTLLFVHSAGLQDGDEGSAPLLRALRHELGSAAPVHAPIMPAPDSPDAAAWDAALEGHIAALQQPFVAVGHSLGGSSLLRHFALHAVPQRLLGTICIATPFWGAPDWDVPDYVLPEGFAERLAALPRLVFYHSCDDDVVAVSHLHRYGAELPRAELREVSGRGHVFAGVPVTDIAADIRLMLSAPATAGA
jgi:predicted alpha/beta hydrolase family esterase